MTFSPRDSSRLGLLFRSNPSQLTAENLLVKRDYPIVDPVQRKEKPISHAHTHYCLCSHTTTLSIVSLQSHKERRNSASSDCSPCLIESFWVVPYLHMNNNTNFGAASALPRTGSAVALCASCDRCRARKTKCDGQRPCGNCATKYLKKHKLTR